MARTTALNKIENLLYEPTFYKIIQGGQGAGKTFAIMTILIGYCESYPDSRVTVLGMTYNHLADGAIHDFKHIMTETGRWDDNRYNQTKHDYVFPSGSVLEFRSADNMTSRGPRRTVLFVNEANGVDYETFGHMADRTSDFVIIDFNPSAEFWAHTELLKKQPKRCSFIKLTYLDNEALPSQERENIEAKKPKPGEAPSNWWRVYGLGEIGSLEGNIYEGWIPVDEVPEGFVLRRYGVDFGYNDPTVVIGLYENERNPQEICEKCELYRTKMTTTDIIAFCKTLPDELFVCDNSQPSIIQEMRDNGLRAIGCSKTPGEREISGKRYNIGLVQQHIVYYLRSDKPVEREYLTYHWRTQKSTGKSLDEPQDGNDHAMDALAYAVRDLHDRFEDNTIPEVAGGYDAANDEEDDVW